MATRIDGTSQRRSAETIARAIELDIIAADLPAGTKIGSEADLMAQYQASRGVIREAVCLIESHMLAQTRRGVGGGLVVAEPDESVVEDLVSLFLARQKASETEVHEVRITLEVLAMRHAMANLDDRARTVLEHELTYQPAVDDDIAGASARFHVLLAQLSGNKVLQLFIPITAALTQDMWSKPNKDLSPQRREETWNHVSSCHGEIIDAMLDGHTETAVQLLQTHLEEVAESIAGLARQVQAHPLS